MAMGVLAPGGTRRELLPLRVDDYRRERRVDGSLPDVRAVCDAAVDARATRIKITHASRLPHARRAAVISYERGPS